MKTVEVSESALESLKAMVRQLQSERDELLGMMQEVNNLLFVCGDIQENSPAHRDMKQIIAKCTQTQSICDWQEKMNG